MRLKKSVKIAIGIIICLLILLFIIVNKSKKSADSVQHDINGTGNEISETVTSSSDGKSENSDNSQNAEFNNSEIIETGSQTENNETVTEVESVEITEEDGIQIDEGQSTGGF